MVGVTLGKKKLKERERQKREKENYPHQPGMKTGNKTGDMSL